ncbi:MAG TPA: ankyrin repeat domain-containing protein, partial [Polyangia bacterium]
RVKALPGHERKIVSGATFSRDNRLIASASGNLVLVHSADGRLLKRYPTQHEWSNVNDVAFSPDGKLLAAPENEKVRLWDLATDASRVLSGHAAVVQGLAFDPTGSRLASASSDTSARIWNLSSDAALILLARDSEWLTAGPDGIFDASPHGGGLVVMARGLDAWGIDQFAPYTNRPDVLLTRMGLGTPELSDHYRRQYLRRLRLLGLQSSGGRMPAHAPEAEIVSSKVSGKTVKLGLRCRDSQVALRRWDLFVNDVPIAGGNRALDGLEKAIDTAVELTQGNNKVEVSCTNVQGVESYRAITHLGYDKTVRGELYFLGLGVSKYRNGALDLQYADADATELAARFGQMGGDFARIHVKTLTNGECTVAGMGAAKQWLAQAKVDDTVVLFVAGHGLHDSDAEETYYYLTHEADPQHLAGSAAPFDMLEDMLVGTGARRKLVLMDTCESGERDGDEGAVAAAAPANRDMVSRGLRRKAGGTRRAYVYERDRFIYNNLLRRSGAIVLSSSRGGEASYESAQLKHGFFTAALLRGLSDRAADRNHDGHVSTDELGAYVGQLVPTMSHGLQQPTVDRDNLAQRFAFPMGTRASASVDEIPAPVVAAALQSAPAVAAPVADDEDAGAAAKKACERGDLEAVQRLVPGKVSANWKSGDWSLVMTAAYKGRTEVLNYLLKNKGDPNAELGSGYTALMQACRWGYAEAALSLIAAGADVNKGDGSRNGTALHITIEEGKGSPEILHALLGKHARTETRDSRGRTPLMLAAGRDQTETLGQLIKARAAVNAEDESGMTALDIASMRGAEKSVSLLLTHGASVKHQNKDKMTALFHASHGGHAAIVRELLAHGADPNPVENKYGDSALMRAAQAGHREVVEALLAKHAKVNLANNQKSTALHLTAFNGHDDVVKLLLDHGADTSARDAKGQDAAAVALGNHHTRTAELIKGSHKR